MSDYMLLSKSGRYTMEVVGCYHYPDGQRQVREQAKVDNGSWDKPWLTNFQVIPEPDNPHEDHALSVRHDGVLVGYISMEKNRAWWPAITNIVANGRTPVAKGKVEFWGADPTFRITLQMANPKYAVSGISGPVAMERGGNKVPGAYGKLVSAGSSTAPATNSGCASAAAILLLAGVLILAL